MKDHVHSFFQENLSYKVVAFFITLILWLTILGRRDLAFTQEVDLDFIMPPGYSLQDLSVTKAEVRLAGTRKNIKKFKKSRIHRAIAIDLRSRPPGNFSREIPYYRLQMPYGIKVVSVQPSTVTGEIVRMKRDE